VKLQNQGINAGKSPVLNICVVAFEHPEERFQLDESAPQAALAAPR
jgi:hypothetical protein